MSGTDIREALHEVAAATAAPAPDQVAFQRLVRRERRHHLAARAGVAAVAVAAAAAVIATVVTPFLGDEGARDRQPATSPPAGIAVDLQTPVYFVADRTLTALDPQGGVHDLGLRSEEVVGYTSESVYAIGPESEVVRFDVHNSDEGLAGPGSSSGSTRASRVPVQGAALSPDGRWLGWIDLDGRLTVRDLKAGTTAAPVDLPANSGLSGLAQGTGDALVSEDGDLVLHTADGPVAIPTARDGYGAVAQAARDVVAVMDRDDRDPDLRRLVRHGPAPRHRARRRGPRAVRRPPGLDQRRTATTRRRRCSGLRAVTTVPLSVPGRPQTAAWADDDTALVTTYDGEGTALYACEVATQVCERLPLDGVEDLTLAR